MVSTEQRTLNRLATREFGGIDDAMRRLAKDAAVPPTPEREAKLALQIARIAEHLSSPHRIVPRVEDLGIQKRISPNMVTAAKYYMMLAFVADGPSSGVGRYGDNGASSPAYGRTLTSDERLVARRAFKAARRAAFGMRDISGREVFDEAAMFILEPILLGDDLSKSMSEVGEFLSSYRGRDGKQISGTTELAAVLRRLRTFFCMADD